MYWVENQKCFFAKFRKSCKITSRLIKYASQFAKCEARICFLKHIYLVKKTDSVPSQLLPVCQWPHGNTCNWTHYVHLHIVTFKQPIFCHSDCKKYLFKKKKRTFLLHYVKFWTWGLYI